MARTTMLPTYVTDLYTYKLQTVTDRIPRSSLVFTATLFLPRMQCYWEFSKAMKYWRRTGEIPAKMSKVWNLNTRSSTEQHTARDCAVR